MKEAFKLTGFILVAIGLIGLVLNDFVIDLGRATTITFAAINAVGLVTLAWAHWGMKKDN